jgi:hypothetical protein
MEKYIKWKLVSNTEGDYYMYYELDINLDIIDQLIDDNKVYIYGEKSKFIKLSLSARLFGDKVTTKNLDEYTDKFKSSKKSKVVLLAPYREKKYPSIKEIIRILEFSLAVKEFQEDFKFIKTHKEGYLESSSINMPKRIGEISDLILYLWKK